jgi:23S rRNA (uracil1939-C5)-methyltransferase
MASNGQAVARDSNGKVVFVDGALPGEEVAAEIRSQHSQYSTARLLQVLTPSPDRIPPPCPELMAGCGGCPWQQVTPPAQARMKRELIAEAITRIGRLGPPSIEPTVELVPWGYRTSLRAGVIDGRPALRRAHSDDLVPIERCLIVHPLISSLLGRRFEGASEILLRCGATTGERLASLTPSRVQPDLPADVRAEDFHEVVAGRRWRISARSFFQSRADGAEALARLVVDAATEHAAGGVAVDLYSGVGLFAGALAERGWSVTAVEGSSISVRDARANLADLGVDVQQADVTAWKPRRADLVVADPSRTGLGVEGADAVAATAAARVVLVSCDSASLGRDLGLLVERGFEVTRVTPVDMFPHSFRVEVVTVMDRSATRS